MDGIATNKKKEEREIRDIGKILIWGGSLAQEPDIASLYFKKFKLYFDLFFSMIDRKNGNWMHLPFSGGVADQPHRTMQILEHIRNIYFERLEELNRPQK